MRGALLLLLASCGPDPNATPARVGALDFAPCPLSVEPGRDRPLAQCATAAVPLYWDEPDGEQIEIFVQRVLPDAEPDAVLWMLAGGPGQSASVYESYVRDLQARAPGLEIRLYEHRGVGRSTRLDCWEQEALDSPGGIDVTPEEWEGCLVELEARWGEDLAAFSSAEAARDLGWLATQGDGLPTFLYGASYGTTLAHRALQRFGDTFDGVILDSIAIDVDHRVYDAQTDAVGREFLDRCAADPRCAEALGPAPHARARSILGRLEQGWCAEAIDPATLRRGAAAFLADASLRGFVPALFHRVDRCAPDDVTEIRRLVSLFEDREPHPLERLYSPALFVNVELSEQWPAPWPAVEDLEAQQRELVFSLGLGPAQRPLLDLWPRYPTDPADAALAVTDTPLLMLQGGLDPQTPLARTEGVRAHFDGPGQHFVVFPEGAHVLLGSTPAPGGDCATGLLLAFLEDPLAAPDPSCVDAVAPIRFDGQPLVSALLLGDCSRYGDGCGGGRAALPGLGALGLLAIIRGSRSRRRPAAPPR